jgi:hypothetical protein
MKEDRMQTRYRIVGGLAAALIAWQPAWGQAPSPPKEPVSATRPAQAQRSTGTGMATLQLLGMQPLYQDLGLTEQQQKDIAKLGERLQREQQQMFLQLRGVPLEQQKQKVQELQQQMPQRADEAAAQAMEILTPQQRTQFEEIRLHITIYGTMIGDPSMADRLNLSAQQKQQLQQVHQQLQNEVWKIQRQCAKQVATLLTPEQRGELEKLQNEPAPQEEIKSLPNEPAPQPR